MNLLAAPFGRRFRTRSEEGARKRVASRRRPRAFGEAERLERRDLMAVDIAKLTPDTFFINNDNRTITSEYEAIKVTNNSGSNFADVWVKADTFTGGVVSLGTNEDGYYQIGALPTGASDIAYFYLRADAGTSVDQTHTIRLYEGDPRSGGVPIEDPIGTPVTATSTFFDVYQTLETSSNKIFSVAYDSADPVLGSTLTMTVTGDLGQANNDSVLFSPASFDDWLPDVYVLETMTINITGTNARTLTDDLYDTGFSSSSSNPYTAVYTFRLAGVSTGTTASPTQFVGRGGNWKHHDPGNVVLPPVSPVANSTTVEKLVALPGDPGQPSITILETGASTIVEFSLRFTNTSTRTVTLNSILDTLPSLPANATYVLGTSTYDYNGTALPIGDPSVTGQDLKWLGPFTILGNSTAVLKFRATIPAPTGTYVNSATGRIGTTVIDTTLDTKDYVPATAIVVCAKDVNLELDKVTVGPVVAGQLVSYTIAISNSGKSDVTGAVVTDPFAGVLSGVTWTAVFSGGSGNTSGSGNISESIDLSAGGSVLYSVTGLLASSATGSLVNTATVTSPFDSATDTVTDAINRNVDLTLDKVTVTPVVAGQLVSYTIAISNSGKSDVTGAAVTDPFAGVLSGVTWTAVFSGGSGNTSGSGNISESIDLSAGGSVLYSVTGLLASSATGSLVNTATVTSPFDTATDTVTDAINRNVDLTLDKVTVTPVVAGQLVSYTIAIANSGKSDVTGAVVTDPFAGVLSGVTWTAVFSGGGGNTSGSGNISESIDLSAGGSVLYSVTGLLASSATGSLVNTATVTSPFDTATDTVTDAINRNVDLTLDKVTVTPVVAGQLVSYTIAISNSGKSDVTGAAVTDPFAGVLSGVTWTAVFSGGSGNTSGSGNISESIDLSAGGSVLYSVTGLLASSATGSLVNTATVTSPFDSATDTVTDAINRNVDLTLDKVTVTPVVAGQLVSYTIAIANSGKSDVTGAVVTDPFAGVLSGVTWTAVFSGGSGNTSGSGNISESIDLSAGGSVLYSVTGLLASSATGSLVNTATVTSPFDSATDTVTDPITGLVDLDVTKTGDITYKGGGPLNFTVIVTNNGPSFASGVRVVDALPAGVVSWSWTVTYTGTGSGTADGSPDSVTASTAGIDKLMNLAVLGTATFSITALTSDFKSDISNTATASIGQESATATWTSAYDGPINPTADVAALIIGTDDSCGIAPWVRVVDPVTGTILSQFLAYEPGFRGGVRVTSGDVTGDGIAEIIVGPGRNRIGQIRVFTPQGVELTAYRTFPFGTAYRGGVEVAVGDIDGDGDGDIIAGMSTGNPMVRVFKVTPTNADPVANAAFQSFRAFPAPYANGTMVAAGDFGTYFNGVKTSAAPDGIAEIVTGTNAGTRAWTRIWDVSVTPKVVRGAFVIAPGFRGGVTLSTARWDGDAIDDVVVGAGIGGNSIVEVYSGATGVRLTRLTAFSSFVKTNARAFAAALDLTGDGIVDNLYGVKGLNGGGGARGVRQYARSTGIVSQLSSSPLLAPPLRIAPITLRVPAP